MLNISLTDTNGDAVIGAFHALYRDEGYTKLIIGYCTCIRQTNDREHREVSTAIQAALKEGRPLVEIGNRWSKMGMEN